MALPAVVTNPATDIEAITATLNGLLSDDGGEPCDCGFEWGPTPALGNTTPTQSKVTGESFAQDISGLSPKQTYHFRAKAVNYLVPYTGTWYFYLFMTCRPSGELYIGLGNDGFTVGGIYHSLNYGNTWTQILNHDDFGGVGYLPLHLMPSSQGYVALVWDKVDPTPNFKIWQAPDLAGPWNVRHGAGPTGVYGLYRGFPNLWRVSANIIWCSGYRNAPPGGKESVFVSTDGGLTWTGKKGEGALVITPGQVYIVGNRGFLAFVGTMAWDQYHWSDNPMAAAWNRPGIAHRAYRFGATSSLQYVVGVGRWDYWYSSDYGHTGITKGIPAGMQTGSPQHYYTGVSMNPSDRNKILAAPGYPASKGVWLSEDFGGSWSQKIGTLGPAVAPYLNNVMWDLYDADKAYAWGKEGFFRSDDGGHTWYPRNEGLN